MEITKNGKLQVLSEQEIKLIDAYFQFEERKKTFYKFSFGTPEKLKEVFMRCFQEYDPGIKDFCWLKEYDEVVDWMADNKGKGLFLTGSPGMGKSNIILGVIVPLFNIMKFQKMKDKYGYIALPGMHASNLISEHTDSDGEKHFSYEQFRDKKIFYIDELGTERMAVWYGEKFEAFGTLLDWAEQDYKVMIISSNLDGKIFKERYGERALDRLEHLCRIVTFKGKSLRPK